MRAVWRLVAHELRARWQGWAMLALLVAVAGGAVLTAAAGARRTGNAYPRFLHASKASDVLVSVAGSGLGGYYGALARLPGVAARAARRGCHRRSPIRQQARASSGGPEGAVRAAAAGGPGG